jgi:thiamine kinase-like enzyme
LVIEGAETDQLLDRIPVLAGPRQIEELSGGLTNRNLKVTTASGTYVVRVGGPNAEALGIDRDVEHHNSRAAAEAGVGAPVVDYRPDLGVLVIGYLEGATLTNADFARDDVLQRAAVAVRRLHDGPRFRGRFDMVQRRRGYLATAVEGGFRLPAGYRDHEPTLERVARALAVRDEGTVPCNNDLLAGNFVDDGVRTRLIDYEYSGNNDACFELGNMAGECELDLDQLEALVTAYYGRTLRNKVARARLQCAVGQYGWTLWGCIQAAVSPLDFDFWSWGVERYEKAVATMTGPDLDQLLIDVEGTE